LPYCVASDVTAIIRTKMSDAQITAIIEESDAWIDKRLGTQTSSDKLIRKLSKLLTAREVKTQQPTTIAIGEYSERHDPDTVWAQQIKEILDLYKSGKVVSTPYEHIDEDDRYQEDLRE
jgi:hypothetical protein